MAEKFVVAYLLGKKLGREVCFGTLIREKNLAEKFVAAYLLGKKLGREVCCGILIREKTWQRSLFYLKLFY